MALRARAIGGANRVSDEQSTRIAGWVFPWLAVAWIGSGVLAWSLYLHVPNAFGLSISDIRAMMDESQLARLDLYSLLAGAVVVGSSVGVTVVAVRGAIRFPHRAGLWCVAVSWIAWTGTWGVMSFALAEVSSPHPGAFLIPSAFLVVGYTLALVLALAAAIRWSSSR
ncbi:hypothetical protein GCM10017607_17550 [Microbacterium thalassium]|nr:hypothetical protein GCM10017607_17550 [Microbacterium thalassium]